MERQSTTNAMIEAIIAGLAEELPVVFTRKTASEKLGGILAAGSLANLNSQKKGPPTIRLKRHAAYERETFLAWLHQYLQATAVRSRDESILQQ